MSAAVRNKSSWARAACRLFSAGCGAVLVSLLAGFATLASATTYTYTGALYTSATPFTGPCTAAPCTNYTTAMRVTGSFTTAAPLAANLNNVNIVALVTSFSFNDGINTYSSSDPNTRIRSFDASTDNAGVPNTSMFIDLEKWLTGSTPHTSADRWSQFEIDFSVNAQSNLPCTTVGTSGGVSDVCTAGGSDQNTSRASNTSAGTWVVTAGGGPVATSTGLGSSLNPSTVGQSVTFTATVTGSSPTGTVQFRDGASNLGSPVPLSGAVATLSTSALSVATHAITAVYSGDANNAASTSPVVNQVVNAAGVVTPNAPIPTLSEWALVLLIGLMLVVAARFVVRRHRR
jgi:Bacterial Ig-like domain (group 3)/IPTL-CTERM motif